MEPAFRRSLGDPRLGHTNEVYSVVFSPDGHLLASSSEDNTIRLWDVGTGQSLRTLTGHASAILHVAFSPDGHRLASCGADATVWLWDPDSGQHLLTLIGHAGVVRDVVFSPCLAPTDTG